MWSMWAPEMISVYPGSLSGRAWSLGGMVSLCLFAIVIGIRSWDAV